jgi:hypothetical protein
MNKTRWSDQEKEYLLQLIKEHPGQTNIQYAGMLIDKFNRQFSEDAVRKQRKKSNSSPTYEYKETIEKNKDGSYTSDKLIKIANAQNMDDEYLLSAHGYDPNKWEVVTARNSIWNQHNKQDGTLTLYASKITVQLKRSGMDWDKVLKKIKVIPAVEVKPIYTRDEDYLNIPLFDMHFGISDYEYYRETQMNIMQLLEKGYKEVLFIIGQDMLHNDDFRGRTASGREIDKVDMEEAWDDAMLFYVPIIEKAIEKSKKVSIKYSKGNHDESMSWAFVKLLQQRFPQAEVDTRFKERKAHMLGTNFIGMNHGDKKKEDKLSENFSTEFPFEWSRATTREIFTGHLHTERVIDKGGVVLRRMPTGNKIDGYHDDHGYTTAHKRFEVLEYTEDKVKRIHYV